MKWWAQDEKRPTNNMATKSMDVNNHLYTSPCQERHKDEKKNKADSYKTCVGGHLKQ